MLQEALLDVHKARQLIAQLELAAFQDDINKLKEFVAEKAGCAAKKLDRVHNYLMRAFDDKWEVVLHKAQVPIDGQANCNFTYSKVWSCFEIYYTVLWDIIPLCRTNFSRGNASIRGNIY